MTHSLGIFLAAFFGANVLFMAAKIAHQGVEGSGVAATLISLAFAIFLTMALT